jgi:hypothetical protein
LAIDEHSCWLALSSKLSRPDSLNGIRFGVVGLSLDGRTIGRDWSFGGWGVLVFPDDCDFHFLAKKDQYRSDGRTLFCHKKWFELAATHDGHLSAVSALLDLAKENGGPGGLMTLIKDQIASVRHEGK